MTARGAVAHNNVAVPFGATVYDAVGGGADDYLVGNELDNVLTGGPGDDVLDGAGGQNTAVYAGKRADFTVTKEANGNYTVTDLTGKEGVDTLIDIQLVRFADTAAVAIDSLL
jgi:serralysin